MVKRKREDENVLPSQLAGFETEIFRALKQTKTFERRRQGKKLNHPSTTADKKSRMEKEILVLKGLDLHRAAHVHLTSSLLRIKTLADHAERLPENWRALPPKPEMGEEETVALRNVTSALVNKQEVRMVVDKAVNVVCDVLGVELPVKAGKNGKGRGKEKEKGGEVGDEVAIRPAAPSKTKSTKPTKPTSATADEMSGEEEDEREWGGFSELSGSEEEQEGGSEGDDSEDSADLDAEEKAMLQFERRLGNSSDEDHDDADDADFESASSSGDDEDDVEGGVQLDQEDGDDDWEAEEKAVSGYDQRLAESDSSDDSDGGDDDGLAALAKLAAKYRGKDTLQKDTVDYDDISSSAGEGAPSASDDLLNSDSNSDEGENSFFDEQPPAKRKRTTATESKTTTTRESNKPSTKETKKTTKETKTKTKDSTPAASASTTNHSLPSLLGGYVSGSESEASDIEIAPVVRKNRRGQRARQKIWEKRHGEQAKHHLPGHHDANLTQAQGKQKGAENRNAGWDMQRGAVEAGDGPGWKAKGNRREERLRKRQEREAAEQAGATGANGVEVVMKKRKERDDEGQLHPSWEAKKLAKKKEGMVEFKGTKVVFD